MGFPGGASAKNLPANAGDKRDTDLIPGSERSPGGGHGNPLQSSSSGESRGQRNLVGYSPYGCKESDRTEATLYAHTENLKILSLKIKISIIFPVVCVLCYMQSIFHIPFDLIFGILIGDVLSLKSHKWRPRNVTILPKVTWLMSK